jgi:3D-(3,5/4)-trihydroxycyclohexane-1,2-dione acylhydrolase (decyclizing)
VFFEPVVHHPPRPRPPRTQLAAALQALRGAERPLIVAGGGVHYAEAGDALRRLAERLGAPVAETSAGKGAIAGGHPLAVGAIGHSGTRAANRLAREADLVVHVGTRLIDLTTGSNTLFQHPDVAFVGVNVAPGDAGKLGATTVVADAREALDALDARLAEVGHAPRPDYADEVAASVAQWSAVLADDLRPRAGERMSQAQVLHALNAQATAEDALVVASGTPHVDVHKLWDTRVGTRVLMEVGFSCMGHEIPAALGVRMAGTYPGEVYAVIGDGTYLMGPTELVTAVQEGQKITVLIFENHGFQSIHALQRGRIGRSFGLEFRHRDRAQGSRLTGEYVTVDLAANARSFGATAFEAATLDELRDALAAARREAGPCVIVARVEPHRLMLDSECWWDVGIAEVSTREETRAARAAHDEGRARQRHYG